MWEFILPFGEKESMNNSKTCTKCRQTKELSLFAKDNRRKNGVGSWCKECLAKNSLSWVNKNKERVNKKALEWYYNNKTRARENERRLLSTIEGKTKKLAATRKRQSALEKRTPPWLSVDDLWMIEQAYELAVLREQMTGIKWHVDHIVPLRGKTVSGLHVPWNLQVIPATDNIKKGNKYDQA